MSYVTHLECAHCGKLYEAGRVHNLCPACQRPLWVRYDLGAVSENLDKKDLKNRPPTLWRYLEILPVIDAANIVSLSETVTPILATPRLGRHFGLKRLLIKERRR